MPRNEYEVISDEVGWQHVHVPYPTLEEVEKAVADKNVKDLLRWNRFLIISSDAERPIWERVVTGLFDVKRTLWGSQGGGL